MSFAGETIWVIGASSGIGKALCQALAKSGAQLILSARNEKALEALKQTLGTEHKVFPLDVADASQVKQIGDQIAKTVDVLDRVIFMAATYEPKNIQDMDLARAKQIVEVNLLGAMHCTKVVMSIFLAQGAGQLALCASSAGYVGLAGGQPYSATKAGLMNFAESLYAEVEKPIDIKLINPGFVKTPMTDRNTFHMPMRIAVEDAAAAILKGLNQRAFEIHFPKRFTYMMKCMASLPYWLQLWVTRQLKD